MKVAVDANVILDVLLKRVPFDAQALPILALAERGGLSAYLCATTVTTIYYLLARHGGAKSARRHVAALLGIFAVAPVDHSVLLAAAQRGWRDYEDAVLHEAAVEVGAEAIITRNASDFRKAEVPVYTPDQFNRLLRTMIESEDRGSV